MRFTKIIIVLLFYSFLPVKVVSQVKIFSLEDAIITALENNRQVKIGRMNIEKAEAAVNEAFGYALPSVDVSANFSHLAEKPMTPFPDFEALLTNATYGILFNENIIPEDNSKYLPIRTKLQSFALANSFETKAQVTQILFNSAVFRGIGASEIYLQLAKVQMEATISNTILEVKKAFYGVLVTKELLQILQTSLINAEENLANIKALHAQGFTSDYDAMQVEVRVENLKPNVLELENILSNAKNGLKILLNINQNTNIDVTGEFHYSPLNISEDSDYLNNAVQKNLDIQSLSIKKQVDKEFIAIERSEYWPTIAAFGSYAYSGSSDEFDFKTYRTAVVGLSLSMNLFKGGRVTNRVEQAQIATMQTEEQITQLKDYVSSQVINKLMSLKKVQKQVEALTRNVALAQKAYDISVVRYKEGTGTQLEIKNADTELQNAKTMYTKSLHDHIIAGAELDQLLGFIDAKYANVVKDHINE